MAQTLRIGDKLINKESPCYIIAEAGVNHNGSLVLAKQLIDAAVNAGVDAVKFQTYITEKFILKDIEKAAYQKQTTNATESQTEMLKRLEIDKGFHLELIRYCKEKNITFLSTCYEEESLNLLIDLDVCAIKIASTDTTNLFFLEQVAKKNKPVILSTGMCSLPEIQQAYDCLRRNGCKELALLKCTSNYPTDIKDVNLHAMKTMREEFDAVIGFSDHTQGVGASPYSVALGAKIIEKHFTLDKNMEGPDHKASLNPGELILWVNEIRRVEKMLGKSDISLTESESETKLILQKYLVAKMDLKKGHKLTRETMEAKRTGGRGISALEFFNVLGLELKCDLLRDQPIDWMCLKKELAG